VSKKTCVIIGYGGIGRSWQKAIKNHPDWELVGVIDTDTELLENVTKMGIGIGEDQIYTSIEECAQFGHKPDLAIVATPIYYHHSITREVMDLDINVICEKNMASTLYEGRQMVQYAKDKPHLCTAVDTQYRYGTNYWTAHQFFKQETTPIGKLGMIKWESADYRGEKRWAWRRALPDVYLEDMSVHWFDTLRYTTSMDIVQVKADVFMPKYSDWHGSSEVYANLALAKPQDYNDRHNWVWAQFYGGWQRNGPTYNKYVYYGGKGQAEVTGFGLEMKTYPDKTDTRKFEEDAFLPIDAGPVEGTNYTGQEVILDMMSKGIDSGGEQQPGTNFCEAFKSFAVSVACSESSRFGKTVWVPDYWKGLLD